MAAPKRPQDHLPPKGETVAETVTVTIGGTEYESQPLNDVFTPKWMRANRRRDPVDALYTQIEAAFSGVTGFLDAFDELSWQEQADINQQVAEAVGATLGESLGSSPS